MTKSELLRLCEFDEAYTRRLAEARDFHASMALRVARDENARLLPLLHALLKAYETARAALEVVSTNGDGRGMGWTAAQHARIEIAQADEILKGVLESKQTTDLLEKK